MKGCTKGALPAFFRLRPDFLWFDSICTALYIPKKEIPSPAEHLSVRESCLFFTERLNG